MITQAVYTRAGRRVVVSLEGVDTWLEERGTIVNFPGLVELDGDRLYMTVHRARHTDPGGEPLHGYISEDAGATWSETPAAFPLKEDHPVTGKNYLDFASGILGYLRDGSIARIDPYTVEIVRRHWQRSQGTMNVVLQMPSAHFVWRHWTRGGAPLERRTFEVEGRPWTNATYENYASLIELDNGDLVTALMVHTGPLHRFPDPNKDGSARFEHRRSVAIIRSGDRGRTWRFAAALYPWDSEPTWGPGDRPLDKGFAEPDVALLPSGDLLCVINTGSYSPLFQSRSTDGGQSWSTPVSTGWPGVKPRLRVLPNGVLACASGRGAYGHPQITHVMLSLDGTGEHWEQPFAFHTGPGCSYTSTMLRAGKLHVVYSHSDFTREMGTHELQSQRIRRAVFDIQLHG